jgi:hypothetical protein
MSSRVGLLWFLDCLNASLCLIKSHGRQVQDRAIPVSVTTTLTTSAQEPLQQDHRISLLGAWRQVQYLQSLSCCMSSHLKLCPGLVQAPLCLRLAPRGQVGVS